LFDGSDCCTQGGEKGDYKYQKKYRQQIYDYQTVNPFEKGICFPRNLFFKRHINHQIIFLLFYYFTTPAFL